MATWQERSAHKRAEQLAQIPKEWRLAAEYLLGNETSNISVINIPAQCAILNATELDITERYTAVSLTQAVQSGSIKAYDIATAFCKRAAIAHQLTNCLTEIFFTEALERGKWLDEYLAQHGKPVGPLHGVPISIKDCINYKGTASTIGLISYLDHPVAESHSPLVDVLLSHGAIIYCKTNLPQAMMSADSDNNVFGRTLNPHNLTLTAGGSSGGEGALVAMRGSLIGVGTDIGGSIRIPALCCGTFGFKPSSHRVLHSGQTWCSKGGSPGFPAVSGPLATSIDDIALFMESVVSPRAWSRDPTIYAIPWRSNAVVPESLRIGYFSDDKECPVHPPVFNAIAASVKKLSNAGHTLIETSDIPSAKKVMSLARDYWSLDDSGETMAHINAGEEPLISSVTKETGKVVDTSRKYTVMDVFDMNNARAELKKAWHKISVDKQLDVLLCPGARTTAVPHDSYPWPIWTAMWNMTESPAMIIPVGKVDQSRDSGPPMIPDANTPYRRELVNGAPTAVQIVGRSYQDEELIAACRIIDRCLNQ